MHADAIPDANRAELADPARVAARIVARVAGNDTASGARVTIRVGTTGADRVGPAGATAAEAAR